MSELTSACKTVLKSISKPSIAEYEKLFKQEPNYEKALKFLINAYRKPLDKKRLLPKLEKYAELHPEEAGIFLELADLHGDKAPQTIKYLKRYVIKIITFLL